MNMNRFLILTFIFLWAGFLQGQTILPVEESARPMSKGTYAAFTVEIPQTTLKQAIKDWDKYLRNGSKEKAYDGGGEHVQPGVVNKNVAPDPFKVYSTMLETTDGVRLSAWFSLGNDSVFISKEMGNDRELAAQKYVRDFAVIHYREIVKQQLADEKDKKKKMESELKDLIKQEEKSVKNINEAQRSIGQAQDAISTRRGDEQRKSDLIYNQKAMMERMESKDGQLYKDAEKVLKSMEKEKEKLQNETEKENGKIDDWNRDIREEKRKIDDLKQDQRIKRGQTEEQKKVIAQVETKLKSVK